MTRTRKRKGYTLLEARGLAELREAGVRQLDEADAAVGRALKLVRKKTADLQRVRRAARASK